MVTVRLLTATARTQGFRGDDFHWYNEGELVWVHEDTGLEELAGTGAFADGGDTGGTDGTGGTGGTSVDQRDADVSGIGRAWIGLSSHRATTTARVRELPFSLADVRLALRGYLESAGFARYLQPWELERALDEEVGLLIRLGRRYPVDTVVERRGPYMRARPADPFRSADVA